MIEELKAWAAIISAVATGFTAYILSRFRIMSDDRYSKKEEHSSLTKRVETLEHSITELSSSVKLFEAKTESLKELMTLRFDQQSKDHQRLSKDVEHLNSSVKQLSNTIASMPALINRIQDILDKNHQTL